MHDWVKKGEKLVHNNGDNHFNVEVASVIL